MTMICGLELGTNGGTGPGTAQSDFAPDGRRGLWELAKACGSTVEAIRSANGLGSRAGGRKAAADPRQLKNRAGGRNPCLRLFSVDSQAEM